MYIVVRWPVNIDGRSFMPHEQIPRDLESKLDVDARRACIRVADPLPARQSFASAQLLDATKGDK